MVAVKSGASGRCPAEYSTALVLPATSVTPLFPPVAHPVSRTTASATPASTVAAKTTTRRLAFNTSDPCVSYRG